MEILKLVLLTLLLAVALACVLGILLGKRAVKKAANQIKPLLSRKERILYILFLLAGIACLLTGIFLKPQSQPESGMEDPGMMGGQFMEGMESGFEEESQQGGDIQAVAGLEDAGNTLDDSGLSADEDDSILEEQDNSDAGTGDIADDSGA